MKSNSALTAASWLASLSRLHPKLAACGDVVSASATLVERFGELTPAQLLAFSAVPPASVVEHRDRRVRVAAARLAPRQLAERLARDPDSAVARAARQRLAETIDTSASPTPEISDFSDEWYASLAHRIVNDQPSRSTDPDDREWVPLAVAAVVRAKRSVMGVELDRERLTAAVEEALDEDALAPARVIERRGTRSGRRLTENLTADVVLGSADASAAFAELCRAWSTTAHPELCAVLAALDAARAVHQTNHWIAKSGCSHSDHALFGDLAETAASAVDRVAERAVGLGSETSVSLRERLESMSRVVDALQGAGVGVPGASDAAERSLAAEFFVLRILSEALESMTRSGTASPGCRAMLEEIADERESAVYLLRRRSSR